MRGTLVSDRSFSCCSLQQPSLPKMNSRPRKASRQVHQGMKKVTKAVDKNAKKGFKKVHKEAKEGCEDRGQGSERRAGSRQGTTSKKRPRIDRCSGAASALRLALSSPPTSPLTFQSSPYILFPPLLPSNRALVRGTPSERELVLTDL